MMTPEPRTLAPRAVPLVLWRRIITWLILGAIVISVLLFFPVLQIVPVFVLLGIVAAAVIVEIVWAAPAGIRAFRYQVSEDGITTASGVLLRTVSFVPMQQVLVVEIQRGPLLRAFGLVCVQLKVPGSNVEIDGITPEAGEELRCAIVHAQTVDRCDEAH